jgi:hypothetical protein
MPYTRPHMNPARKAAAFFALAILLTACGAKTAENHATLDQPGPEFRAALDSWVRSRKPGSRLRGIGTPQLVSQQWFVTADIADGIGSLTWFVAGRQYTTETGASYWKFRSMLPSWYYDQLHGTQPKAFEDQGMAESAYDDVEPHPSPSPLP